MKVLNLIQGSPEWHKARECCITGTKRKDALAKKGSKARENLINQLIAEEFSSHRISFNPTPEMQRGTDEEDFAIKSYEKKTGNKVKTVGMWEHEKYKWLRHSPDGAVKTDGVIEIKSPNSKTVVGYIRKMKVPKEYEDQVKHAFEVNEKLKWCDFIIHDPRFHHPNHQLLIIRVERKDIQEELDKELEILLEFRKDWQTVRSKMINLTF